MSNTNKNNEENNQSLKPHEEIWDKQRDEQYQEFLERQMDAYLWNY